MAKKSTTSRQGPPPTSPKAKVPQGRRVKLSDGTVVNTNDNNKSQLKSGKMGKHLYGPQPTFDEDTAPEPDDEYSGLEYPPPKKNPVFRKSWGNFIENVISRDNFKPSHLETLEILCDMYVELDGLNKFLSKNGMTFKVVTVFGEHRRMYPEVAQRDKTRNAIHKFSRDLDLFPKKDKLKRGLNKVDDQNWE